MMIGEIALGTFVTLELERQGNIYILTSKVFDTAETEILIAPPTLDENSFRLLERDKITVVAKIDAQLFRWECEEWNIETEGVISTVRLKCSKEGEKYNRRNAFRIPIDIEVKAAKDGNDKQFDISIRDISYLGVGFSSYEDINIKDKLHFTIVDEEWKFPLEVIIARKEKPKIKGYNKYFYGSLITVSDRDLSRYIVHKQLEMVRKKRS
jgi:hypothetical protein